MTPQIFQPDDALQGSAEAPFAIVPAADRLFAPRAERFRQLAAGHPQADWLRFLAALSAAQHAALADLADCEPPSPAVRAQARQHLMPPLATASLARHAAWKLALQTLLRQLAQEDGRPVQKKDGNATSPLQTTVDRLQHASSDELETLASKVLDHQLTDDADRASSVFIAAALQVYWTVLAGKIAADSLLRLDNKGLCPCCGSLPVASLVRIGGAVENLRYLHCSLCNTEWNLVRVTCASCDDNAGIAYHSLHGAHPAVRAETCDSCQGYLKIVYLEKDPLADPVADDLATLALDLLLDEAAYQRAGPNLLLLGGG